MKVNIEAEMPERWMPYFVAMLEEMEHLGAIGSSKALTFYSDGDGDYRPKFSITDAQGNELSANPEVQSAWVEVGSWVDEKAKFYDAG